MIKCLLAEGWWWRGRGVGARQEVGKVCERVMKLLGLHPEHF